MPLPLSQADAAALLKQFREKDTTNIAYNVSQDQVINTDVFIAGSGPNACTYARTILDKRPSTDIVMAEIGSQDDSIIGGHHKNAIKYQKDFDAFVNVIRGALQPVSVPPGNSFSSVLARDAWAPPGDKPLVSYGNNPLQSREKNVGGVGITRTVGGMASHWTCSCPVPHVEERKILHTVIPQTEIETLLDSASDLLGVRSDQFDMSIRHNVVKEALKDDAGFQSRGVTNIPLAVKRRTDNPDYLTWSACDTILGEQVKKVKLLTETRVTRLHFDSWSKKIDGAILRDLNTDKDILVVAKVYVIACGAVATPQILWNSSITPPALGRYLSDQSLTFCQIILKREIIDSIWNTTNEDWKKRIKAHHDKYPDDPLPIPFRDPEPQVMIPYHSDFPWHVQIHRDSFSYGEINFKADPRVVVDLRFFGKSDISEANKVTFSPLEPLKDQSGRWEPGKQDIYGMPQATFEVTRSDADGARDQRMMKDMTEAANILGGFLPGVYPQFMEPGITSHMTGTTRIGKDPKTSVANADSRVHGIDNLWVAGNGCIPDATASNPTRTSMAIAIKGANAVVTYLHQTRLPKGAYIISNVAVSLCVGPASDDRSRKQPIISKAGRKSIWMVRYFEDGIYDLSPNKISTTVENNRVWCDTYIENQERWQILQRAPGVNEYTIIASTQRQKGWTLRHRDIGTQVSLETIRETNSQIDSNQLWSFIPTTTD